MHVVLLVEVHVNYLIITDLSSLFFSIYLMVELVLSPEEKMDLHKFATLCKYRKISPAAYIFQRAFLRGLWRD